MKHPQVATNYHGSAILVDEQMVNLLRLLWARNITTMFSCQGETRFVDQTVWGNKPHRAYIMMLRTDEAMIFITDLFAHFSAFKIGQKILWDLEFDRHGYKEGRIVIRFPNSDIEKLVSFLK